ncbi:MAG: hypothetical protein WAW03_21795 [Anaerolineae bacterium]|uniref:hypothetical protein n=1 Tax=Candidatus Amarolinea dominans TaxID=3140696 RepID=UPI003136EAF6|nr:hypothetical protein [Anaerolineae bacterium]MBK9230262.1 hypothetical protein [Anaerolineae bacterium]
MELRHYWNIILRRWWLPLALVVLVALFSLITLRPWQAPPPIYTASMRYNVGLQPEPRPASVYTYDRYYTWLGSEYLIDDLSEIVKGSAFAAAVSRHLADSGLALSPGAIQGSTQTGKLHRILTLSVSRGHAGELNQIMVAISQTMQADLGAFYAGLLNRDAEPVPIAAILIDGPQVSAAGPGLRAQLELPLRLALALLVGLALCFFLDYLDTCVRDRADLEALGLAVLAEIPRR